MLTGPGGLAVIAAASSHRAPLDGHLWHTIEALGFLITSLGGIAVAEFLQARRRNAAHADRARAATAQRVAVSAGGVGLLPERPSAGSAVHGSPDSAAARTRWMLLPLVALAGAAAAAVHFVVMPEHFDEATMYGVFFAVAATSQLLYSAMLLARPSRSLLAAGAIGNLTIVVLWLITRTIGIPLGPAAGTTETVGGLDVLATIFELTTAVGAVALLCRRQPLARAIRPSTWSPLIWALGPIVVLAIAVTAVLSPPS
jgi:hypothetical protein